MAEGLLVVLVCTVWSAWGDSDCQDMNTQACELLHTSNPALCDDPALSETACPRFCKLCPLTCFHCETSVTNYTDCAQTKVCAVGEQCMLREMRSTADGHEEYIMACASVNVCDGMDMEFAIGRREIHERNLAISCCDSDLCNSPLFYRTTTTAAMTTPPSSPPTSPPVTLAAADCARDVFTLIESGGRLLSFRNLTFGQEYIKSFLKIIVSNLTIGDDGMLMEVALIDNSVNKQWDLNEYTEQADLLDAIDDINFRNNLAVQLDLDDIFNFLRREIVKHRSGDRVDVQNDVILILDNRARLVGDWVSSTVWSSQELLALSGNIIVIGVGSISTDTETGLNSFATDPSHVLHVPSYTQLDTIASDVLNLLCS